jgi:hypothetical protein
MSIMTEEKDEAGAELLLLLLLLVIVPGLLGFAVVIWAAEGVVCGRGSEDDDGIADAANAADDASDDAGGDEGAGAFCPQEAIREGEKKALVSHIVMTWIRGVETRLKVNIGCKWVDGDGGPGLNIIHIWRVEF